MPLSDSLQRTYKRMMHYHWAYTRLTRDAVLAEDEMERRIRLILEPWNKLEGWGLQ